MNNSFVLKGHIVWCDTPKHIQTVPHGMLVCENGLCEGVFREIPERYQALPFKDFSGRLVLPALYDLHLHAPQFAYRGLGMDLELIGWLKAYAFPEEAKYFDLEYAGRAYAAFTEALKRSFTARFCCFATLHAPATLLLAGHLEASGLQGYVGKLSMDRNSPKDLCEVSADRAAEDCENWILSMRERFRHIKPIVTPRFVPSCTDALMGKLRGLMDKYGVPAQSHLSETRDEIAWVKKLSPETKHYADAYDRFGMLENAVMAHVVYPEEEEIALLKERGTMVAHCPSSNANLRSGIAPVRRLLSAGVRMGLGSDVAGGESIDMLRIVTNAVQFSKLYWRMVEPAEPALTFPEAFYMATKGGGSFFGKCGSFEEGYMLDALVLDDTALRTTVDLTVPQRLERALYLSGDLRLVQKFVDGRAIL
jgi:guanine deaminase